VQAQLRALLGALVRRVELAQHAEAREQRALDEGAASVASFLAAVVTETYLCTVRACQETLRRNGRG
jgi:hypothetical protein